MLAGWIEGDFALLQRRENGIVRQAKQQRSLVLRVL
jgi:hypothetical protein